MAEMKQMIVSNVIPLPSQITEHKLNGSNYYDYHRMIQFYLLSTYMDDHVTKEPPKNDKKKSWFRDDNQLYLLDYSS